MAPSSFYRHFHHESTSRVMKIKARIASCRGVHLHWVDNYARFIARTSMYLNQEIFRQCYWTAHGVKVLLVFFIYLILLVP